MPTLYYKDPGTGNFVALSLGSNDHGALTGLADDDHPQYVLDTGDTMTGVLNVEADSDIGMRIRRSIGWAGVGFYNSANLRFLAGSNANGDFAINRYDNNGANASQAFIVERATGVTQTRSPEVGGLSNPLHDSDWRVVNPANNWTASSIRIRRSGNEVWLRVNALSPTNRTSPVWAYIPAGFQWDLAVRGSLATAASAGALVRQVTDYSANQIQMATATQSDLSFSGMVHWFTADPWPSSYPSAVV